MGTYNTNVVDLTYLNEMTDGDAGLLKEMIDIFLSQVDEFYQLLNKHYKEGEFDNLSKVAHKAKSSIAIMGMHELAEELGKLEIAAKNNEEADQYPKYIAKFEKQCRLAVEELKKIYQEI